MVLFNNQFILMQITLLHCVVDVASLCFVVVLLLFCCCFVVVLLFLVMLSLLMLLPSMLLLLLLCLLFVIFQIVEGSVRVLRCKACLNLK